jgi:hypothetical protein
MPGQEAVMSICSHVAGLVTSWPLTWQQRTGSHRLTCSAGSSPAIAGCPASRLGRDAQKAGLAPMCPAWHPPGSWNQE